MSAIDQLKQALLHLNASWVLWLLIALFAVGLVISIERALFFLRIKDDIRALSTELDGFLRAHRYRDALERLSGARSPAAAVVAAGLTHADLGAASAEKVMDGAVALERVRLERGLPFLATLANNAPFLGLLGTVIGIVEVFEALGKTPGTELASPTALAPAAIMGGIAEALVSTAVGLFIALPAVGLNNYFQRRIAGAMANTKALSSVLLSHLSAEQPSPLLETAEAIARNEVPNG